MHDGRRIKEWMLGWILRRGDDDGGWLFSRRQNKEWIVGLVPGGGYGCGGLVFRRGEVVGERHSHRAGLGGENRRSREDAVGAPDRGPDSGNDFGFPARL